MLHKVIKQMTVKDLKKNADIFSADDMKIFLTEMYDEDDLKQL